MKTPLRIVAPFRPFLPESELHRDMAAFDWIDAIRMMQASAAHACQCPVHVITDVDTDLPVPSLRYETTTRRLMLWYLEVSLKYLESADFDRDTIALDSDQLIYSDLRSIVTPNADLVVCIRPNMKHASEGGGFPLLNGVQVWRHRHKAALAAFYARVFERAQRLPEDRLVWGADTDALRLLLEPLELGLHTRSGLVVHMVDANAVIEPFSTILQAWIEAGTPFWPSRPVVDFRWKRKPWMRPLFEHTYGRTGVTA